MADTPWQSRIVDFDPEVDPTQLLAHPLNARRHPGYQRDALRESLDRVGWVDVVKVNTRTGHVVDGHARVEEAITKGDNVPVVYVDLDEDEERFVLATLDPISALATYDGEVLQQLLDGLSIETEAVTSLLDRVADGDDLLGLTDDAGDLLDHDDETDGAQGTGAQVDLADVGMGEPSHKTSTGDHYLLGGKHHLFVVQVTTGWKEYGPTLAADDAYFVPYPAPHATLTNRADEMTLVLVQPDTYLAGHVLDKWAAIRGDESITKVSP
jgi:hypothetical protein